MPPRILTVVCSPCSGTSPGVPFVWLLPRYISSSSYTPPTPKIPPESPKFIEIPQLPQRQGFGKRPVKGVLPVPRQIFPKKGPDKTSTDYLANVTPDPTVVKDFSSADPSTVNFVQWKARSAATRRTNLREGLVELKYRKEKIDRQVAARSAYKRAEHDRAIHQPEREDERLTNPSIIQAMTPGYLANPADPHREERLARQKARVEHKQMVEREERRNALHSLYMNARTFIVTEDAWKSKVDQVFDDEWFKRNPDRSIWDKEQFPDTVYKLLDEANQGGSKALQHNEGYAHITRKRVQRIAEELTGGKM